MGVDTIESLQEAALSNRLDGNLKEASVCLRKVLQKFCEKYKANGFDDLTTKVKLGKNDGDLLQVASMLDSLGNVIKNIRAEQEKKATSGVDANALEASLLEARHLIESGLSLRNYAMERDPASSKLKILVARSHSSLATLLHATSHQDEADQEHLEALNLFSQVPLKTEGQQQKRIHMPPAAGPSKVEQKKRMDDENSDLDDDDDLLASIVEEQLDWEKFCMEQMKLVESKIVSNILDLTSSSALSSTSSSVANKASSSMRKDSIDSMSHAPSEYQCRLVLVHSDIPSDLDRIGPLDVTDFMAEEIDRPMSPRSKVSPDMLKKDMSDDTMQRKQALRLEMAQKQLAQAKELDRKQEHIPKEIYLDPYEQDVVHIGRQTYEEALSFFQSRGSGGSKRRTGFVRLDSQEHERLISRRHAQIKFSRVHPLLEQDLQNDQDDDHQNESLSMRSRRRGGRYGTNKSDLSSVGSPLSFLYEGIGNQFDLAWVLRDLDSTNGVLVGGVRVQEYPLRNGDIISFGGGTSVSLGCSVLAHQRVPPRSVFVYRFESNLSRANGFIGEPDLPLVDDRSSLIKLCVESFSRKNTSASPKMEEMHFFLNYMSILSILFPERIPTRYDMETINTPEVERELAQAVEQSQKLYYKAISEGIPFPHWSNWLRAELMTNRP